MAFEFAFDDFFEVVDNAHVQSWSHFTDLVTSTSWFGAGRALPMYRPLTSLSYLVNHSISGLEPWSYHLLNVVLHGCVVVLVLLLGRCWNMPPFSALAGAAIFAVHPVHVEVVANIAGRKDLLAALFVLAMLLAHARALERGKGWIAVGPLCFGLALLSKELGVVGLVLVALQDFFGPPVGRKPARLAILYAAHAGALAAWSALRWKMVGGLWPGKVPFVDNPIASAEETVRVLTAAGVAARGLLLQLLPLRLSPDYSFAAIRPVDGFSDPWVLTTVAMLLLIVGVLFHFRRQRVGWLLASFYVVALMPTANVVVPIGSIFGERFLYLPSVAFSLAAGLGLGALAAKAQGVLTFLPTLAVAGLFALRTLAYEPAWRNDISLFGYAVRVMPDSMKAHVKWGEECARQGRFEEAVSSYRRALEILPGEPITNLQVVSLLDELGRFDEAEPHYAALLRTPPSTPEGLHQLGVRLRIRGRLDDAAGSWQRAISLDPSFEPALSDLGSYYLLRGDHSRALEVLERAVAADPRGKRAWYNLALVYARAGRLADAENARKRFEALNSTAR